jgi:ABC-type multidrug transport system ATPase subunit
VQVQNNNASKTILDPEAVAIRFTAAHKSYGKKVSVLVDLDMTIPKGSIYGLLGPSGCGKTTLLQCIVGKQDLQSGEVTVFGGRPGSKLAGVPGPRVGYMPQELAMYYEFTIRETLNYFGHIFGMTSSKIEERTNFLMEFLDLPRERRLIRELSGGQQRRASLAAALLHEPELLILDEPTVGVDPLLRQCIWNHLLDISRRSQLSTTIVVTTHYIEEARQADVVGMMRFGRMLAEDRPDHLLELYEKPNLESVFLHLCASDDNVRGSDVEQETSCRRSPTDIR